MFGDAASEVVRANRSRANDGRHGVLQWRLTAFGRATGTQGHTRTATRLSFVHNARQDSVMENNRIEGIGHQVKGAVKESLGNAIGDAKLAADGTAERAIGDAQNAAGPGREQVFGIDIDRIMGIGHQFKGTLMQRLGGLVGNPKLQAEGVAERLAGKAQNAAGSGRDLVREAGQNRHAAVDTVEKVDPLTNGSMK